MTSRFLTISAALLVMSGAPAAAQTNGWLGGSTAYAADDYRTSYADAQRQAYDNGYRDGLKRGEQAARDRKTLDIERERDYRSADSGYNRNYGDRVRYQDNYRGGFAQGYRDAYSRYGGTGAWNNGTWNDRNNNSGAWNNGNAAPRGNGARNGNNGRWGNGTNTASYGAYQNGVSDGYQKGLDDAHDRKAPDVTRQKWYRNGDHDYNSNYGSKDTYRVQYRQGFEEGYNRAYRDGRRF
jgi:hypothetical protein